MIDSITITDPGFPWFGWWWTGAGIGVLFLAALVLWIVSYTARERSGVEGIRTAAGVIVFIAVLAIPLGAFVNGIVSTVLRSNEIHTQKVAAMAELGYHSPSFSGDSTDVFTAIKDDSYVLGTIVEDPALTWRLVVIDTNKDSE